VIEEATPSRSSPPLEADAATRRTTAPSRDGFTVDFATANDDAGIRALLRSQPMDGAIRVSLEREPAAGIEGDTHHTVVVRDDRGRIAGVGSRSVGNVWFNGQPARLGYLGTLRRDPKLVGFFRLLRAGFAKLETTRRSDELPFDLTSVVADNLAARRALERGLPGLPRYEPWREYVTLIIPTSRRAPRRDPAVARAHADDLPAVVDLLSTHARNYQFAPQYTEDDFRSPNRSRGLSIDDFLLFRENGEAQGCLAIWDQRAFKQIIVHDYSPALSRARPFLNLLFSTLNRPTLPPRGSPLRVAAPSHAALYDDNPDAATRLIAHARHAAALRNIDYLLLGLPADSAKLRTLRRAFKPREYRSVLYLVSHRERAAWPAQPDARPTHVEVATL